MSFFNSEQVLQIAGKFYTMKKLFFSVLFLTGFGIASQAQSGSIFVQGSLGADFGKSASETKSSDFSFRPYVGYQFNDNWTAGILLGFQSDSYKPLNGTKQTSTGFEAGAFARYSVPLSERFSFFGQGEVAFGQDKDQNDVKANSVAVRVMPGIQMAIQNGWALNFTLGGISYGSYKYDGADNASTSFDLNLGEALNIGVSKNIGGK